jgi:hypothetical protein
MRVGGFAFSGLLGSEVQQSQQNHDWQQID